MPGPKAPPPDSGFVWADYVDWIVATAGSLAAAAERLCAHRGYKDDVASAERALRRLRRRGTLDGGSASTTPGSPPEGGEPRSRALAMAREFDDATLLARLART